MATSRAAEGRGSPAGSGSGAGATRKRRRQLPRELDAEIIAFGERLRLYRLQAGLSQLAVAERAAIDMAAVSFIERAKRAPTLGTLVRLARALEVPPKVLIDEEEAIAYGLPSPLELGSRPRMARRRRRRTGGRRSRRADGPVLRRFGDNLRQARLAASLSQEHLAYHAQIDRAAVSVIERGGRAANLKTVLNLARALGKRPAELLDGIS